MGILWAILLFSFLILVHELGHFIAAKSFGVQVNEFSLFMGPAILQKKIGETVYSLRCIPFGGFCAMEGEDEESDNPRAFTRAAWWKRLIILVAGVTMNAIFGLIMAIALMLPQNYRVLPQIESMESWSTFGGENGLQSGDRILEIDGQNVYIYQDISLLLITNPSDTHDLLVERDGKEVLLKDLSMIKQEVIQEDGTTEKLYGMNFAVDELDFGEKLQEGFYISVYNIRSVPLSLKMLFTGAASVKDVSGPVGIVKTVSDVTSQSSGLILFLNLMSLGSLLSLNLAVMNLLPIPALDGGRAVCLIITTVAEKITGKKIDPKYEGYLHGAGMVFLLVLMALITFKDIFSLF